jgi:hypothetical protein
LKVHFNQRSSQKVMGLQNLKNFNFEKCRIPNLQVHKQNDIWVHALWPNIENTIRGKVVVSFKFRSWWVLWVRVCPYVHQRCSNYALTNLLFSLCMPAWIIDSLIICFSPHPETSTRPSTPELLQARECTPIFYPFNVFTLDLQLSLWRSLVWVYYYYYNQLWKYIFYLLLTIQMEK